MYCIACEKKDGCDSLSRLANVLYYNSSTSQHGLRSRGQGLCQYQG